MDIHPSARKHGIADADIKHATAHAMIIEDMAKKTYGRIASGLPITDELVDELSAKAEAGYDI